MPIRFQCGKCQTRIKAPDGSGGKSVKCPSCGEKARVPTSKPKRATRAAKPDKKTKQTKKSTSRRKPSTDPAADGTLNDASPVSDDVAVEPAETEIDLRAEPDVEQHSLSDSHLAAIPIDEAYYDVDEATVADQPSAEVLADTQEAVTQESTRRLDGLPHRTEAEPLSDYLVAAPSPVTRAVPVAFTTEQPQRSIELSAIEPDQDKAQSFSPLTVGPAPKFSRLQVCAWLLWGLAVTAVLVAVVLAIWHPISFTGDDRVNRRLMLLCGVGAAAFFWTAAEFASAARRFFRDGYSKP